MISEYLLVLRAQRKRPNLEEKILTSCFLKIASYDLQNEFKLNANNESIQPPRY